MIDNGTHRLMAGLRIATTSRWIPRTVARKDQLRSTRTGIRNEMRLRAEYVDG